MTKHRTMLAWYISAAMAICFSCHTQAGSVWTQIFWALTVLANAYEGDEVITKNKEPSCRSKSATRFIAQLTLR